MIKLYSIYRNFRLWLEPPHYETDRLGNIIKHSPGKCIEFQNNFANVSEEDFEKIKETPAFKYGDIYLLDKSSETKKDNKETTQAVQKEKNLVTCKCGNKFKKGFHYIYHVKKCDAVVSNTK